MMAMILAWLCSCLSNGLCLSAMLAKALHLIVSVFYIPGGGEPGRIQHKGSHGQLK